MKRILLLFIVIIIESSLFAQSISVASFKLMEDDLTANTAGTTVYDQNGEKCALIKVKTIQTGFSFDVGSLGVVRTEQHTAEIWVYVPAGVKRISIAHQYFGRLEDYDLGYVLQGSKTYAMSLVTGSVSTIVNEDDGSRFFVLSVTPQNAIVKIDEKMYSLNADGQVRALLPMGKHSFTVEAIGYSKINDTIQIQGTKVFRKIELHSISALLKISAPMSDATIFVNEDSVGTGSWQGSLNPGLYRIRVRKDHYHTYNKTICLSENQVLDLLIPDLTPKIGGLVVGYLPNDANVYLDDSLIGGSPDRFLNVIEGKHNVIIQQFGYNPAVFDAEIKEGQLCTLNGDLEIDRDGCTFELKQLRDSLSDQEQFDMKQLSSQALLSVAYQYQLKEDYKKMVVYEYEAASRGYSKAQNNLGNSYCSGLGVSKDSVQAYYWYRKSAEQGYAESQTRLGRMYRLGKGISQDYSLAYEWFLKAASQNDSYAMWLLGLMSHKGEFVDKDDTKSFSWYLKSAEQGNPLGQFYVGCYYYKGIGTEQDSVRALSWFRKSADQGYDDAQCALGKAYLKGEGVAQDSIQAFRWYFLSAEQGNKIAQNRIGVMYYQGKGANRDLLQALSWFKKSAEQGYHWAQLNLGNMYRDGKGCEKDVSTAIDWYRKAAKQGNKEAKEALIKLGYNE